MYPCVQVANKVLGLALGRRRPVTPLQLMKLVYMSHGWMLGLYGRSLVAEPIQAWRYGPVIPELYTAIRQYKDRPIPELIPCASTPRFEALEEDLINQVFDTYGGYDGIALSDMTHAPGSPWHKAWQPDQWNRTIPNDWIQEYYARLAQPVAAIA